MAFFFFSSIVDKRLKHCPELGGKAHREEECLWTPASPYSKCFPSHVIQSSEFSDTQKTLNELIFFCEPTLAEVVIVLAHLLKILESVSFSTWRKHFKLFIDTESEKTGRYFLFSLNTTLRISTEDAVHKGK